MSDQLAFVGTTETNEKLNLWSISGILGEVQREIIIDPMFKYIHMGATDWEAQRDILKELFKDTVNFKCSDTICYFDQMNCDAAIKIEKTSDQGSFTIRKTWDGKEIPSLNSFINSETISF